ncbi:MAG TPA: MFS transporter [Gemmataceae bacterium]|jgi:MFS family permease
MVARATNSRRTLLMLCLASAGWAFSFGLGAPLASLWLRDAGRSARVIGLNTSLYYLGIALASLVVPYLMRRASRACVVGGILADAAATTLFPWADALPAWFALRLTGGMATALSIIPMETLVNHNAPPQRRARDFGFYAFSVALGIALGSLVGLPLYPLNPRFPFALGGAVTLASALLAWLGWPVDGPALEKTAGDSSLSLRKNSLSYGTAWVQGFLEGGLITFLSIYLLGLDYTEGAVSLLIGGLFAGVILCQVPVAWLADRLGRLRVLLGCHSLLLAALLFLRWCPGTASLSVCLFLLGTCCGALYPLGLALLGDRVPAAGLARANACYLASNCAGSLCGPVLFGLVIDVFGLSAQFFVGVLSVALVVGVWAATNARPVWERG